MSNVFYLPTAIAAGLVTSYLGTMHCHARLTTLTDGLSPSQLEFYQQTKKHRLYYFLTGVVMAVIGAGLYFYYSHRTPLYHRIVHALIFLLLTPMIVYTLFPKSPYMLQQPDISNQETRNWFSVYLCMKNGTLYGFCTGFLAALIVMATAHAIIAGSHGDHRTALAAVAASVSASN
jgi:hypothetical protein